MLNSKKLGAIFYRASWLSKWPPFIILIFEVP